MPSEPVVFVFDYVDPLSFLVHRIIEEEVRAERAPEIDLLGLELRVPPEPILSPEETPFADRWSLLSEAVGPGEPLGDPMIVPWTRKAHELRFLASEKGVGAEVHSALFRSFFQEGKDIGRVDLLVRLAMESGLDYTETKAVLDIDKFADSVEKERLEAAELGWTRPPALVGGRRCLDEWESSEAVVRFLRSFTID